MQTQYAQPQNGSVQNGKLSNPATPHIYVEDFLDPAKHDALFAACARLQYREMRGAFGKFKRHQTVAFSSVQVISFYDKRPCLPLCSAPLPIQDLAVSLSDYAGKEITYLSVVRYLDGNDYFRFHQHREDKDARDASVYIVSTGAARLFSIAELITPACPPLTALFDAKRRRPFIEFIAKQGSLIALPASYNDTHQHAVPKDPSCRAFRYAINAKHVGGTK